MPGVYVINDRMNGCHNYVHAKRGWARGNVSREQGNRAPMDIMCHTEGNPICILGHETFLVAAEYDRILHYSE